MEDIDLHLSLYNSLDVRILCSESKYPILSSATPLREIPSRSVIRNGNEFSIDLMEEALQGRPNYIHHSTVAGQGRNPANISVRLCSS
jgi:hypothetical protein